MPSSWKVVSLEDVTDPSAPIRYGVVQIGPDTPDGVPIIPIKHIGRINDATLHCASPDIEAAYTGSRVKGGDVLISVKGTIGDVGVVPTGFEGNIAREIARIRPNSDCDADFLSFQLQSDHTQRRIDSKVVGSTRLEFSIHAVRDFLIALPPLPEQRKIAEILRIWDEAIEKLEALRAAKERRLETLRDALLFEGLRIGEVRRNRPMRRIGEVTRELTARNGDGALGRDLVMGVTNSRGIVPMREQTVADDIGRYKKLPPLAFAYNPMRINVGSIAMNSGNRTVLVSPDYVVFACDEDGIEPGYLDHLRQTRWWLHHINSGGSGSVRQRTYYADLAALHLPLHDLGEQREIVKVLNTAKADVAASAELGETLARQKRGLMQKLLTGEWRVKSGEGP
ncbi:restriction endonuclease subunit S [Prosthecomicrobium hirschii]|uniref:restriction endonuclease subunit S n=1 Tax=Prosthecodimorpha hirschii TaxID=665126 RepID=UPI0022202323|nr:restriction endonuclease subunit S [Prosthecomicrobium hirschii]MCW1842179.1 restriction endonuclease subunit S [Prosthecomicrobium hirschii]